MTQQFIPKNDPKKGMLSKSEDLGLNPQRLHEVDIKVAQHACQPSGLVVRWKIVGQKLVLSGF